MALCLSGCTAVVMETAKKAREDRTTDHQWTDTQIATSIFSNLSEKDNNLLLDVNVDVWEQRVLLTGTVVDNLTRQELVRRVKADPRVLKAYDEIQVVSKEEQARRRAATNPGATKREGTDRVISDVWVETKISAQLIAAKEVTSVNYRWRSVRSTVYLIGRAQSRTELNTVVAIVRATEGVSQVRQFIEIKLLPKS
jgi:osmotically-inducible protein OsmY